MNCPKSIDQVFEEFGIPPCPANVSIHARNRATTTLGRGYASPKRDYPPEGGGSQPEFVFDQVASRPAFVDDIPCEGLPRHVSKAHLDDLTRWKPGQTFTETTEREVVQNVAQNPSAREIEDRLLTRCVTLAQDGAPPAVDQREANVFRLAAMIVQFDFPDEATRLMRAAEAYFTARPDERLEAGEVVRRGWIIGLPRLRDSLSMRLGSRPARWLA